MRDRLNSINLVADSYSLLTKSLQQTVAQTYDSRLFPSIVFRDDGDEVEKQSASLCQTSFTKLNDKSNNLLLLFYSYFCKKYGLSHPSSDVQEQLSQGFESIASAFLIVGESLQKVQVPHLTVLNFDRCYFGGKQLMALADLLGVSYKVGDNTAPSGASLHACNFSLVPYLSTLSLRDAKLNYYENEDGRFDLRFSETYDYSVVSGNDAFGYLLRSLRGHPSLATLDLSENPLGSYLLTRFMHLVKNTPSLIAVHLERTLMSKDEVETVAAYCRVNELRQAKSLLSESGDATITSVHKIEKNHYAWVLALRKWVAAHQKTKVDFEEVLWSHALEDAVMRGIVSEARSPYVTTECTVEKMLRAYSQLKNSDFKASTSCFSPLQDTNLALYSDDHSLLEANRRLSSTLSSKNESLTTFLSLQESLSHALYTPYFLYYLPNETPEVWSPESIDVLRSAFVDPVRAYNTFLCGRPVPRGVPRPIKSTYMGNETATPTPTQEERRCLIEAIADSALLRRIFLTLLPPLRKPAGPFKTLSENHPQYRTVAEENYYFVCNKQKQQRELLLNKLVDCLVPVSYRIGDVLYKEGSEPTCIFFIPPSVIREHSQEQKPTEIQVRLKYILPEADKAMTTSPDAALVECPEQPKPQYLVFREGDFVGELEVLAGIGCFSPRGGTVASPKDSHHAHPQTLPELLLQKNRFSKATLQASGEGNFAGDSVRLWQLPKQVAFFFLHQPFQQMYQRTKAILEYFPTLSRLSPMATLAFAYAVEPFVVELSRKEVLEGSPARIIADKHLVGENVYLLAKGEYTFSTFTALGSWIDKILFSGSVVVSSSAYRDVKMDSEINSQLADAHLSASNVVLGKAIALRQFREAKRWKRLGYALSGKDESTLNEDASVDSGEAQKAEGVTASAALPLPGDQRLSLDVLDADTEDNTQCQWKYYAISNNKFLTLSNEVKSAVLSACAIVTS